MNRVGGKRALVTAAGQGIGRAIALALQAEGAEVVASDRDPALLQGLPCELRQLDVTDAAAVSALEGDGFDVLVNCAGIVQHGTILQSDDAAFDLAIDVNVRSAFRIARACLPAMIERGGGSILNIASVASSIKGVPDRLLYSMSKAALIGLTKAIAADFVSNSVRCNAICPGTIQSPSLDDRIDKAAVKAGISRSEAERSFVARQPMGRLGRVEEVAALAVYLASDESAFTTGAVHIIDGGWAN